MNCVSVVIHLSRTDTKRFKSVGKDVVIMAKKVAKSVKSVKATPVKAAPVKKAAVKKTVVKKAAAKKVAKADDEKKVIFLVNIRIAAEDKIRLQKAAAKMGQTFQKFAAAALKNRYEGNPPEKTIARKRCNDLDAVITCRMTPAQKRKVKSAAKAEGASLSAYILATVFGQY